MARFGEVIMRELTVCHSGETACTQALPDLLAISGLRWRPSSCVFDSK